jgi:hypothetical protein
MKEGETASPPERTAEIRNRTAKGRELTAISEISNNQ